MANDQETVSISAIVSGNGQSSASLSKPANIINMPIDEIVDMQEFFLNRFQYN